MFKLINLKDLPGWVIGALATCVGALFGLYIDSQRELTKKDAEIRDCERLCALEKIEALKLQAAESKALFDAIRHRQDSMIQQLKKIK